MRSFSSKIKEKATAAFDDHPGEQITSIAFMPLMRQHWDQEWMSRLQQDLTNLHGHWERSRATPLLGSSLPKKNGGVYMFVWRPNIALELSAESEIEVFRQVLYLGIAEDQPLATRFKTEYQHVLATADPNSLFGGVGKTRRSRLKAYFCVDCLEYWYCEKEPDSKVNLKSLETRLIKYFNPPLNHQKKMPSVRALRPEQAF